MSSQAGVIGRPFELLNSALGTKRPRIQEGILEWETGHPPRCPWRQMGNTPDEVLIGELLLNLVPVDVAVAAYNHLVRKFVSIRDLAGASNEDIDDVLSQHGLQGYGNSILAAAKRLMEDGKGSIPADAACLLRCSGLEDHGVSAVMCFGYCLPVGIVTPQVARMLSRLFGDSLPPQPSPGLLRSIGEALVPGRSVQAYNCGFLDVSDSVCADNAPLCERCPVGQVCDYASQRGSGEPVTTPQPFRTGAYYGNSSPQFRQRQSVSLSG